MNRQDEKLKAGDTEAAQKSTGSGARRRFRRSIIALSLAAVLGISTISARILSIPAIAPVQRAHALGDGLMQNGMMIMLIMMLMGMMRNNNNGSQPVPNNSLNNNQQPLPAGPLQPSLPGSGSNGSANPLLVGAPFIGGVQAIGNLMNPQPSTQPSTQPNTQPSTQPNVQPNTPSNPQQASSGQNGAFAAVGSTNPSKPASTNQGTSPAAAPSNALSGSSAPKPSTQAQPQTQEQQNGFFQKI